ncbi:hypothetical protein QRT61_004474 [Salmonella enterica]|nr:hypothetical protein [Salmonella enterica]ELR6457369.1 hypothetical protein [Salmonella enterica]
MTRMKLAILIILIVEAGVIFLAPQEYKLTVLILNMTVLGGVWLYGKYLR